MPYLERAILQSSVEVHRLAANHSFMCSKRVWSTCDLAVRVLGGRVEPEGAVSGLPRMTMFATLTLRSLFAARQCRREWPCSPMCRILLIG